MDNNYKPKRLKKRILVPLILLYTIIILFIGYQYYKYSENSIKKEKLQELKTIAELKIKQITEWKNSNIKIAEVVTKSPLFRTSVRKYLEEDDLSQKQQIIDRLNVLKKYASFEYVSIADSKGKVLITLDTSLKQIDSVFSGDLQKVKKQKETILSNFQLCKSHNNIHIIIISPIFADKNRIVANLILQIEPSKFLYPLIQSWPIDSETGETLLFEKTENEIVFLNELKHKKETALKFKIPLSEEEVLAVQGALGKRGPIEGKDYRGEEVLGYIAEVEGTPWIMVAKTDKEEIMGELRVRAIYGIIIMALLILFATSIIIFIYKLRQKEISIKLLENERELLKTQQKYRTILYSIGDAVITTDTEGYITLMNKIAEDLTGWKEEEAKGRKLEEVFNIINEESRKVAENPVERVIKEGIIVGLANHTVLISRDGNEYPIADAGAPIIDDNNNIIGVVLVFRDQTKEREQEAILRESEEKFRNVFQASNVAKSITLVSGEVYPNKAFCELLGYTEEEFIQKKWTEITHPDDLERNMVLVNKLLKGEIDSFRFVKRYLHKNGSIIWVDIFVSLYRDKNNNPQYFITNIVDITDNKKKEDALKLNNIRQKALINLHNMKNRPEEEIYDYCIEASIKSLQSKYAFFGLISEDESIMKIHSWSKEVMKECAVKEVPFDFILSESGIWADCIRLRKPLIINDYKSYQNKKGIPEGHVEIERFISVPIFEGEKIVAVAAVANKAENYTESDLNAFLTFMNRMWEIISYNRIQKGYMDLLIKNQAVLDSVADIIMEVDTNKIYTWANQAGYEFFGEDVIGKEASYYFVGEQDTYEKVKELFEGSDKTINVESWQRRKDGEKRLLSWRCRAIKDTEGNIVGIISTARDITEKRILDEKIKESEERFRILFNTMENGGIYLDAEGKIIMANDAVEKILGVPKEKLIGEKIYDLNIKMINEDGSEYKIEECPTIKALATGEKSYGVTGILNSKDNEYHWLLVTATPEFRLNEKKPYRVYTIFTDITKLKRTENELKLALEQWDISYNAINDGMVLLDANQRIIKCNKTFLKLFNKTEEEVIGNICHNIVHSTDCSVDNCPFVITKQTKTRESMEMNINGMICNVTTDPILDENGDILGAVHIITDITKIKNYEKELIQAKEKAEEMNRIKTHFLANMSHELRTPMVAILGFSEILTQKITDEKLRKNAELVYKGATRLMSTLNKILDVSLIEAGQMPVKLEDLDIIKEAKDTVSLYKDVSAKKNLNLEFESEFEDLYLKLDKKFIEEILDNLINNAIKYTEKGGVKVRITEQTKNGNSYIDIDVIDTGIGIEDGKREIIWEEFRQASEGRGRLFEGTGLGLSISKKLVKLLGGEIFIKESKINSGTTFTVRFPLTPELVTKTEDIKKIKEKLQTMETQEELKIPEWLPEILYVEDEEDSITLVEYMLKGRCKLDIALNGEEAIEKAKSKRYDIILMDINLRKGLDGVQVTEIIRKMPEYEKTPIVAITAFAMIHEKEEFLQKGCTHYLSKPFNRQQLVFLINEIIENIKEK